MQNFVEGWTEPIPYTINVDGAALDLSGLTVELALYDCHDLPVAFDGELTVTSAASGQVEFAPAAGDLVAADSPYSVRFKITSADGVSYFPSEQAEVWNVRKP